MPIKRVGSTLVKFVANDAVGNNQKLILTEQTTKDKKKYRIHIFTRNVLWSSVITTFLQNVSFFHGVQTILYRKLQSFLLQWLRVLRFCLFVCFFFFTLDLNRVDPVLYLMHPILVQCLTSTMTTLERFWCQFWILLGTMMHALVQESQRSQQCNQYRFLSLDSDCMFCTGLHPKTLFPTIDAG